MRRNVASRCVRAGPTDGTTNQDSSCHAVFNQLSLSLGECVTSTCGNSLVGVRTPETVVRRGCPVPGWQDLARPADWDQLAYVWRPWRVRRKKSGVSRLCGVKTWSDFKKSRFGIS
eukprot:7391040-Prymnesium_polylepis.1